MKFEYQWKNLSAASVDVVIKANDLIAEYASQGFTLTLRQLYYQFVARGLIENTQRSYTRIGRIVNDARLAGLIDWNAIEDRTRFMRSISSWDKPSEIVDACAEQFKLDLWRDQHYQPEVWIEKDALIGVIAGVCQKLRIPHFSCRGYVSQSAMWRAAMRMSGIIDEGKAPVILYFGDHDPSGIDMTRDVSERLHMFAGRHVTVVAAHRELSVNRLALNMDQVEEFNPPPNFAKLTDTRCRDYVAEYGTDSWELDALPPQVIASLIEQHVSKLIDREKWEAVEEEEACGRRRLGEVALDLADEGG